MPVLMVVTFGISTILLHFGIFVEDLFNVTNIVLKLLFYLSGVFYSIGTRIEGFNRSTVSSSSLRKGWAKNS